MSIDELWSWPPRSSARITSPSATARRPGPTARTTTASLGHRRRQRPSPARALQPARAGLQHAPDLEAAAHAADADERARELRGGSQPPDLVLVVPARLPEAQAVKPLRRSGARRQPSRVADEETEADRPILLLEERRLVRDRQQVLERFGLGQRAVVGIARSGVGQRLQLAPASARELGETTGVRVGHRARAISLALGCRFSPACCSSGRAWRR